MIGKQHVWPRRLRWGGNDLKLISESPRDTSTRTSPVEPAAHQRAALVERRNNPSARAGSRAFIENGSDRVCGRDPQRDQA
jgi:hypothetical protein